MSGNQASHSEYVGGLFRSHYRWLCGRLRQHLDASVSVEDIAAETFLQILASPSLVPIREPRALLTTIAQRQLYQLWRRRDLERDYFNALPDLEPHSHSPENRAQIIEALQAVDVVLDRLPSKVKATFLLSHINGLTYPQIAVELGICQRSVSDYMSKALTRCLPMTKRRP
ncbi:sigma-70 family RNA polymerase sigma factor [Pseudomonas sp. CCI1.2]|uniref:sigma-70 family RNA polymerase sigma factor n=1 Tax=Pseudomonas sp. CCI1.2 TaxID=3048614 RepID=UPI002B232AC5|nr:sigma-70 family RNA polymerase sigma factor [Pseudomonas sp. CCI1.2]MEB0122130.1 sigma-70 family RNA polymerase sigma factor [Pseudomonas sp. CCI1.2]